MIVSLAALSVNGTLIYTIIVTNAGPSPAANARLSLLLLAGAGFVSASPGCSFIAAVVSCSFGTLAANAGSSVQIVITPGTVGSLSATVTATTDTPDPVAANNSAVVMVTVVMVFSVLVLSVWGVMGGFVVLLGVVARWGKVGAV